MTTVVISALVSAVVALGIEWFAKPRLEARKEQILRRYRARDEVQRCVDEVLFHALALVRMPVNPNDDGLRGAADSIADAVQSLEEAFRVLMPFASDQVIGVVAAYVSFVGTVMDLDRTWQEKAQLLSTATPMIVDVLGGPSQGVLYWARWRYRARRLHEADAFLTG